MASSMTEAGSSMLAAVYRGGGEVHVEEIPVPALGPHDVLVEIAYCGVCGSDLHVIVEGWGRDGWGVSGWIGGHEWSGRVHAVGEAVTTWHVGDAVVSGHLTCGECPSCMAGRPSLCSGRGELGQDGQGAFAQYLRKSEASLLSVPGNLALRSAALAEPLAVALHAVTRSGARPGHRALVTGAGPIGALVVAALHARGVEDVTVSEPSASRRALAGRLGAKLVTPESLAQPAPLSGTGDLLFDVAIDTSGRPQAATGAFNHLAPGGTLALVGVGLTPAVFDPVRAMVHELTVTGSFLYDPDGITEAIDLLASGAVPADVLIEPVDSALSSLTDVCARLAAGDIAGKVMVVPG